MAIELTDKKLKSLRDDLREDETFAIAGRVRREDLLVHFALMQFPGAPRYRHLPRSIQTTRGGGGR